MTDALLTLAQWLSPAFPVGAFAYSHGLEQAIHDGSISNSRDLEVWLSDLIAHGSGQSDAVFLAAAHASKDPRPIDHMARAFCASAERQTETILQGTAFCETIAQVWQIKMYDLCYPVAVGYAAGQMNVICKDTLRMYLHAFASNLCSAAIRLIPIGQTDGQRVLLGLKPTIEAAAEKAMDTPLSLVASASFACDILAMRHETLQPRIFRT